MALDRPSAPITDALTRYSPAFHPTPCENGICIGTVTAMHRVAQFRIPMIRFFWRQSFTVGDAPQFDDITVVSVRVEP